MTRMEGFGRAGVAAVVVGMLVGCGTETNSESQVCTDGPLAIHVRTLSDVPSGVDDNGVVSAHYLVGRQSNESRDANATCTTTLEDAERWAKASNDASTRRPAKLLGRRETDQYFDFQAEDGIIFRVHRCSYFEPTRVDGPPAKDRILGTLNARPLTADVARRALPYLFLSAGHARGPIVSSSSSQPEHDAFSLDLEVASVTGGDWNLPGRVDVFPVRVSIDPASGEVRQTVGEVVRTEQQTCED